MKIALYPILALEALLLEKQHLLEKTNQELNDLQEYKVRTKYNK